MDAGMGVGMGSGNAGHPSKLSGPPTPTTSTHPSAEGTQQQQMLDGGGMKRDAATPTPATPSQQTPGSNYPVPSPAPSRTTPNPATPGGGGRKTPSGSGFVISLSFISSFCCNYKN